MKKLIFLRCIIMKQIIILLCLLGLSLGFTSCEKEDPYSLPEVISCNGEHDDMSYINFDWVPVYFSIKATDSEGEDLFNPSNKKAIHREVKVRYNGKTYRCGKGGDNSKSLKLEQAETVYVLKFGNFKPYAAYSGLQLVIVWPDGKKDVVLYNRDVKIYEDGKHMPEVNETMIVNGKEVDNPRLIERTF